MSGQKKGTMNPLIGWWEIKPKLITQSNSKPPPQPLPPPTSLCSEAILYKLSNKLMRSDTDSRADGFATGGSYEVDGLSPSESLYREDMIGDSNAADGGGPEPYEFEAAASAKKGNFPLVRHHSLLY